MKTNFYNQNDNSSCLERGRSLFTKWLLCSFIITACLFNSFVGYSQASAPTCPTTFVPANGTTDVSVASALTWSGATGTPAVLGYDVYLGTDSALVASKALSVRVVFGQSGTTYTPTGSAALVGNTTYYWLVVSASSFGRATTCTVNSFTTHAPVTKTAIIGGLWSNPATWGGTTAADLPQSNDDVLIPNGVTLTIDQVATVKSITIGQGGSGAPAASTLQWNATANALTMFGNLTVASNGRLLAYTAVATPSGATINIGGDFTIDGYANLAVTSTTINMCGSTLAGGSSTQTITGTGQIQGNGSDNTVDGIINTLQIGTTGTVTLNTTQSIVVNNTFNDYAGTLATNSKLKIDNTAIIYGQSLNKQLASVPITAMGVGYTAPPVVFGAAVLPWPAAGQALSASSTTRYFVGNNVYGIISATSAVSDGNGPTATTPATAISPTLTSGTATVLWLGTLGSIGNPYPSGGGALTLGTQYFYGDNMYLCTAAGNTSAATAPTHTSGTAVSNAATLLYIGQVGKVSVNSDATTNTVRSLTITNAGTYLTSASAVLTFSPSNGVAATTAAAAVPVVFQSIQGSVNSLTRKSPSANITGSITINSGSSSNPFSGVNSLYSTTGGVNYTAAPTVGFGLPTLINLVTSGGTGYGTAPTVAFVGGGGTGAAGTATIANGRVVSVYITSGGSGYTSWPTITLTGGVFTTAATLASAATLDAGNSLAKATVNLDAATRQIQSYTVTNPGWGYATAPTCSFTTAGTVTTAAGAPTARIGLYNLTYGVNAPATTSPIATVGAEIPSNNKVNILTVGSTAAANNFARITLTNNLNIMAGTSALSMPTSTVTSASVIDLNGKTLTFSNPNYAGVGGTALFGHVKGGDIVLNSIGGSVTRTFPWDAPVAVATGAAGNVALLQCSQATAGATVTTASTAQIAVGQFVSGTNVPPGATVASVVNGTTFTLSIPTTTAITAANALTFAAGTSNITQLTCSVVNGPSGGLTAGTGVVATKRAFRIQAVGSMGATGTVQLNYNILDTLSSSTIQQTQLFVGQSGAITGNWTVKSIASGTSNTVLTQTGTNVSRTTAAVVPGLPTPVDLSTQQFFTFVTTTPGNVASSTTGGLWSNPATWANNRVPGSLDTAIIADGAIVTVDVAANVQSVIVGGNGTGAVLQWNASNNALTVKGDFVVNAGARLNAYTAAASPVGQTINLGGNFVLNGTANLAVASTVLNFTGSTLPGGSLSQQFSGSGTLIGDTINGGRGIIRTLQIASNGGTVTLNWSGSQKLVAMAFNDIAGTLATGGNLSIDNTAQVYGQAFNRQVAGAVVTAMGSTFSQAPVVFGAAVLPYGSGLAATLNTYYHSGGNVYLCTTAGTFNSTAPTGTASTTFATSGPTLLYVGALGTLGRPYQTTLLTNGNQYFYGDNLYVANAATAPTAPPTHTSGTVGIFTYVGSPAKATVNFNSTTKDVRSLTLTSAGSGYLANDVPAAVFSPGAFNASQTTNATAVVVMFQQIVGPATAITTKNSAATITGGITSIRSDQGVGGVTVASGGVNYTTLPTIGFPLPTNYLNLVTAGGSGYTAVPTVTVTGGSQVAGGTAPAFTVVVAQGKVVSVYATGGGTGWLTLPTLTLTGGGGTGATAAFPANCLATATVTLNNDPAATTGTITNITVTNPGFGYESAPTPTFATGLTSAVAAGALTSRVGLYDLSYTYNVLNTSNPTYINGAEVPASRRINKLTMNSVNGASFTNDLEIYGNSGAITLTSGVVNIASGKTLTFSHQLYRGTSGSTTSSVNGDIKATLVGGSLTQIFPFEAPLSVITGNGSLVTGSTITNLTASVTAAPTGSNAPIGTRTYRVVPNSGASYGTVPQVTMSWNANDALTVRNPELYIGQATSTSGGTNGWSMISASTGVGALPTTGSRTSASVSGVAPSPIVIFTPTGDDYFSWISPLPKVTNATVPAGGNCTPTAQVITADIDPLAPGWQTTPSTGEPSLTYSFNGVAQTAIPMVLLSGTTWTATIPAASAANVVVTWGISATNSYGLSASYVGATYADSAFSAANAPIVTAAKSSFCGSGTSANTTTLSVTSSYTGALTYQWSSLGSGTITSSTTASSVTVSITESSDFQVIVSSGGCSITRQISIGVYPFPASTPTLTPPSICVGNTSVLSSGLSASNFSASPIPFNARTAPSNPRNIAIGNGTSYTSVWTDPAGSTRTSLPSQDDGYWCNIPIGFTFNYFGTNYTSASVGSNGTFMFEAPSSTYIFTGGFPSLNNPQSTIAVLASDLWINRSAKIRFWTTGVAPNRVFVLEYDSVSVYDARNTTPPNPNVVTAQCHLFETTGIVEIHVREATYSISGNSGNKYIGLQDITRTIGATAPNVLTGQASFWNGTTSAILPSGSQAWRFSPPAPYSVSYSPAGQIAGASSGSNLFNVTASPAAIGTTNYSVTFTDGITGCSNATSPATASLLVVSKPGTPVISSPITVCGSQSVSLTITNAATVPSTSVVNWYDAAVGGNLLATGVTFITPVITSTTTYYVAEENSACSSVRIPVTVVINQPPALTVSNPAVCSPGLTQLSVTSTTSNYDTYIWSPTASLFQDAAGTVQYTGQSLSTVYAKTTASGIYNYNLNAYDFSSGCSNVATSTLTVQPAVDSIISSVPFICVSGTATLSLSPATTAGTVQWQNSSDGITYSDIVGETGNTYTTGTLSTPSYYKVKINSNGSTCLTTSALTLPVNNPQVTSVTNGSVCGGGQVVLSATGPGTLNWYASNSSTAVLGSGATFTTPSILANTDYYVATVVDGCEGTRSVATASISNASSLTVTGAQVVCNNGIATLSVTRDPNFNKYVWTPITNLYKDAAATIALATGDTAATVYAKSATAGSTTYTITASNTATSCLATATVNVTVLPTSVTVSSFPTLVCSGNSAVISASVSSPATLTGASYEWESSSDGVNYTSVATTPTYTTPNVTTTTYYRLTIKNGAGVTCFTSSPYTLAIASPEVLTTTDGSSCANPASVTLSATGSVGTTLSWFTAPSGGTAVGTGTSFNTGAIASTTQYYVSASVSGCSSARSVVTATVNTAQPISVSANQTVCNGEIATLAVTPNANYTSYAWSPTAKLFQNNTATTGYTNQNLDTVYAKSTTAGSTTYTVTASNSSTGCTTTATTQVRVLPATATVSANPTSICSGGSSTIRISPNTAATYGAATIEWWSSSDNITYTNTGSTGLTYTATPTSNTYYQAIVKNVGGTTCITTSPVLLSVGSPLVLSTQDGSACGTSIVALQATGTAGSTLNWYTDSIGGTLVGTGATFYTPAISATTVYYVEAANGTTCASTRVAVTATINSTSATALTVSANQTVCNNAVATLTTPSNVDYDTYVWSPATGLFNDNAATTAYTGGNLLTVYAQNATAGSYDYYVTASNSAAPGCVATVKTTVSVLPDAITVSAGVDTICNSGSTTLSIAPSTGYAGGSILWQSSTNGFVSGTPTDLGSAATQSTGTLTATTWFRAIIKDGAGANCIISDPYQIVVNTPVVLSATGGSRCGTGTVTLTATAAAGTTLRWYSTLSSSTVLGTGSSFTTPSISTTTNYYVAASINSCVGSAARTLVTATINPPSAISATPSTQSVCNGGVAAITAASNPDYDTYIWSPNTNLYQDANASAAYTGQNQQTVYYKSTTAGTNSVTLTASASVGGCTNTTTAQVLVMPASVTLSSTPAQICGTGTAVLSFTPSTGFGTGSFQWQTASSLAGPYTDISGATATTYTTGTISAATYYRVVVKDGSGNDCFTSTAYTLSVNNPTVLTTTDGSVCGSGTVTLSATTATGNTLSWFTAPSGGSSVGTGASFTTPSITANTVYYVAAVNSGCVGARTAVNATITPASALSLSANQTVCNGAIATISVTPNSDYTNYQWTPRTNLFTNAAATTAYPANNNTATTVYVKSSTAGNYTYTVTATNTLTGCTKTGTTTVIVQPATSVIGSAPSAICVKDKATLSLTPSPSSNVSWSQSPDGIAPYAPISGATSITYLTDSIIATSYFQAVVGNSAGGTCYTTNAYVLDIDNPAITAVSNANRCGSGVLTLTASGTGGTINWYASKTSNASLGTGSTFTTPSLSSTTVYYVSAVTASGCASAKTDALTDTAFINVAPALTINSSQVVCNNSTNYMLNVTSNSADYTNFLWTASPSSPVRLYQDSLSATVYNSATMNEDTVYANVSTPGTTTYTLNATNTITGCSASTSAFLSVLPANTTVTASPSQLCVAGTANLALVPSGPYPIGTIQWQGSPDGITWSNIALATNNTLTTIIQGNTRYYRSVISNSDGNACITTPTTVLTVNNPQVVSTTPITRCGAAPATLFATASAGATLNWYAQATGGALLGTGTSFTTPVITETTTYYVEAAIGSCVGGRTAVTVTYIAPPALTLTSLQSICANSGIAQIDVTSPLSNFDTYVWSCDINSTMYIDAAATIPYTGQNITTIYTKSDSGYTGTFTVNAISGTGPLACVNSANGFVSFVDVNIASVTASPAIVCKGSTVTLAAAADAIIGTGPQVQPSGYLASSATSTADEEIFGVSFGSLTSTSNCATLAPGVGSVASMYSNYMGLTPPTVQTGQTVSGSITLAYCASSTAYSNRAGVYIDWNRDGDFADAGEFVVEKPYGPLPSLTSPVTYTFSATIPTNASPGVTRMRVVFVESATMNPTGTYTWGETEDYLINVISFVQPTLTYTWTPGGLTGATTTDFITANTMYTVTGTDPVSGCSATDSLQVNVTNGPTAPTATDATQCGLGIPTASVTSNSGATAPAFTWYSAAASSGTVLQAPGTPSGSSTYLSPINATQTFYVSEFDGTCNSYPRTPVTVTVNQPDAVVASASAPACLGSSITLTATQTGTTNSYVYTWTSTTNSGITTPVTGSSVSATPTATGTYTYNVIAFDSLSNCTTTSNVTVSVVASPTVVVTPTSSTVCVGTPVQLTANETNGGSFGVTFNGTNAYLAVASSPSLNLSTANSNSVTLEAWIKPNTATSNAGIISKYQSPSGAAYFLRQSSVSPFTGLGAGGSTELLSTPSTGLYTLNNWTHVAAVFSYNASTANDSVKIYKDGVLVRSGVTTFATSPDSLRIGSDFGARYFNGDMDEVRIWNSAIDEATLNTWKGTGVNTNHPNYANLVAYYNFNQPNATTSFTDLSGNGNTAYIRNATQAIVNAPIANSATTYSWSPSAGLSNANIANPIATLTSAGTVNYTVTVTNGAGCTTTATIPVTGITTAGAPTIASSASGVCISGSVNLSVTNPNTSISYQWQQSSTGAVGSFTNISGATATTYSTPAISATTYYRVYATCGTATADTSDALTITAYTPAVTATVDSTRCGPGTVTLGATGNAGTVLNWYANPTGGSPIATGTSYTTPLLNNSTTYYVSATSPAATSTGFVGKTGTTGADGANTGTGIGPIFDALSPFTILTVDLYPNAAVNGTPGTATFTLQNSAGTTLFTTPAINILGYNTATVQTVNVNIPVAAAGTGYRLLVSWTGVTGMYRDFTTTGPNAVTFPYTLPGVCSITGSTSIATYYYYIYNWQVTVPCESGRVPVTATVTPSPAVTIAASASTICQGQSSVLTASSSDTNYVYTWNGGAFTGAAYTVSPTQAPSVTYNVVASNATTGCSALASQTVNVNITPTTPVITSSSAISCVGGSTTLTASSIAIGQGPQTDPGSIDGNPSFSSTNDEEIFNVTLGTLNNSSTCSDVASGPGSANSSYNNYTTTVAAPTLQVGNTYNGSITIGYCATGTFSNIARMWIDYNRNGLFTDAGELVYTSTYQASALTGTAYPFSVTVPSNASAGLTRMRVVLIESATAPTPTQTGTWGEGEDYFVNILAQVPVTTFNWSTGGTTPSISVNPTQGTTTYTVTTTAANGCTSAQGSFSITANAPPTPVLTATDTTLCAPNSINIFVVDSGTYSSGYPAGTSVEWLGYGATGDPATTPINSSQGSTFQAKVTLPSGCFANSNVVTVTTRDIVVVPTITPAACGNNNGKVVAQIASAPAAPYNYVWTDGTNTVRNVTTASTTDSITGLAAGTYFLSVYDNQGGSLSCSATNLSYTVNATVPPVIAATSTNITCNGTADGTVGVSITSGGVAPFTYSWSNGATTESQLGLTAGTYTVTVSDVYGCSASSTLTVTEPAAIAAVETITQPCVDSTNGSISLVVSGGTSPVNVDWFDASFNQLASGNLLTGIGAGTYFALMTDANNCTTTGEYNVIAIGQTFTSDVSACDSYTWTQNSQTYTASGSYTSVSGCDTYVLNLTVAPSTSNTTSFSACDSYTWSVNGTTYTTSGTYSSVTGCNTEILNLTVTPSTTNTTSITACDSYTWSVDGNTYTTSGTYSSVTGCNTEILNLTINTTSSNTTSVTSCGSYVWSVNGNTYTQSGTYSSVSGCNTEVLNLTVTTVSISGLAPANGAVGSTVVISGSGFTGATGVSFNGTAATNFTVNNSGQITATVPVGTTTGPVTVAVGQCSATSSGNFTIGTSATLNLKAYMQGYYAGSGTMTPVLTNQGIGSNTNEVDTITVQLRDSATGANVLASASGVIMTDGTISLNLPADVVGNSYYIVVNHRNTVQTWSATPVTMTSTTSFDFTTAASQAYGDNMIEVETGIFAMFTGDINQDEFIDPIDYPSFEFDNVTFAGGYLSTDLNGDGFVDPIDYPVFELNNVNFVMSAHP